MRSGINFPWMLYRWAVGEELRVASGYRTGLRMRWLGGDIRYLKETFAHQGRPDVMSRERALRSFALDLARPAIYDYVDLRDLRPAVQATWQSTASIS